MENFTFQNATKIIFGKDTVSCIGQEIKRFSNNILFVHYGDAFIKESGLWNCVTDSLTASGVQYVEMTGVKPNPVLSTVRKGIEICQKNGIDFILAVGGGSVIDTAKAIAAGVVYKGDIWDLFLRKDTFKDALPTGVIVTIPATGSESSTGAVITNEQNHSKLDIMDTCLRPAFAILAPELSYTLPPYQTFSGIADMMSHVMERYFTSVLNVDLTDRLCEGTLKAIIRNADILLNDPQNYNARSEIMWAATLAHNDLLATGRVGDWACHAMGMELSALYDSTHGATITVITPAWMKYVYKDNLDRFAQFAMRVWDIEYDFEAPARTAKQGIEKLKNFFSKIGMPVSLQELCVPDDRLEEMSQRVTRNGVIGNIMKLSESDVLNIYKLAK